MHQVVLTGADADFTKLPVHLQHGDDGAPYISASIDVTRSFDGKRRNVGYRRLMLRGRIEAGMDLVAPSDLRIMYGEFVKHRQRMPVAFAIGSHPADGVAAACTWTGADEMAIIGALRGAPVPLVRCATIDAFAPADAEMVLEGYLDEEGLARAGRAIRRIPRLLRPPQDQSGVSSHRHHHAARRAVPDRDHRRALSRHHRHRRAQHHPHRNGGLGARCARRCASRSRSTPRRRAAASIICGCRMRQRVPGEARNAIAAIFGCTAEVKHVFVVDDDVDIFSDAQMEWALATRFQADRDLVVASGLRAVPLDPSLARRPHRRQGRLRHDLSVRRRPSRRGQGAGAAAARRGSAGKTVREALDAGPQSFRDLMEATGSRDGRDVLLALDEVRQAVGLERLHDGRYRCAAGSKPDVFPKQLFRSSR